MFCPHPFEQLGPGPRLAHNPGLKLYPAGEGGGGINPGFFALCSKAFSRVIFPGEDSAYERGWDARRKFWIKPPKETNLAIAQAFFDP